jgi:hypothetical protein
MSASLLDRHLRSTIQRVRGVADAPSGGKAKEGKGRKRKIAVAAEGTSRARAHSDVSKKRKERNYLDEAKAEMQSKKRRVDDIIEKLGKRGSEKKFSNRRLKSLVKIQRKQV